AGAEVLEQVLLLEPVHARAVAPLFAEYHRIAAARGRIFESVHSHDTAIAMNNRETGLTESRASMARNALRLVIGEVVTTALAIVVERGQMTEGQRRHDDLNDGVIDWSQARADSASSSHYADAGGWQRRLWLTAGCARDMPPSTAEGDGRASQPMALR